MKKIIALLTLPLLCLSIVSCDEEEKEDSTGRVPIEKVVATAPVDLSQRTDWLFMIENDPYFSRENPPLPNKYTYIIKDNKITAIPKSERERSNLIFCRGTKDIACPDILVPSAIMVFKSPQYPQYQNILKSSLEDGDMIDQTTKDKLLTYDALYHLYYEETTEKLNQLELTHVNALFEITFEGQPKDKEIHLNIVGQGYNKKITWKPYVNQHTIYQAIVSNYLKYTLSIEMEGKTYTVDLKAPNDQPNYTSSNTHYTFTISYADGEFKVTNTNHSKWSEKVWSVE